MTILYKKSWDSPNPIPGGQVVKTSPSNVEGGGVWVQSLVGGAEMPHALLSESQKYKAEAMSQIQLRL